MTHKNKKIAVVLPAYNASRTLEACYAAIPKEYVDFFILVDDASIDDTVAVARSLGLSVVRHYKNCGYGGNQKTCYQAAKARGADIAIMVHPDHQYDPSCIPEVVKLMAGDGWRAVFGSRMMVRSNALKGGMPKWKFFFNIVLTKIGNFALGTSLTEFHSGFRAYDCRLFDEIDINGNSDDFVFDTQIIIQLASRAIAIKEIPISTRYFKEASQIGLLRSIRYGLAILYNLALYRLHLRKF